MFCRKIKMLHRFQRLDGISATLIDISTKFRSKCNLKIFFARQKKLQVHEKSSVFTKFSKFPPFPGFQDVQV